LAKFLEKQTCRGNSSHENHNGNHFKPFRVETIEENKSFDKFLKTSAHSLVMAKLIQADVKKSKSK